MRIVLSNLVALALLVGGVSSSFADDDKSQDDADARAKSTVVKETMASGPDAEAVMKKLEEDLKNSGLSEDHQKTILKELGDVLKVELAKPNYPGGVSETVVISEDGTVRMRALSGMNGIMAPDELKMISNGIMAPDEYKMISNALSPSRNTPSHLIGLSFAQSESDDNTKEIQVTHVMKGLPAEKAGVMVGDLIVSVNGKSVENANEAISAIQSAGKDGKSLTLKWIRGDVRMEADMKPVPAETVTENSSIPPFVEIQRVFSSVPLQGVDVNVVKQLGELTKEINSLREEIENLKKN